jgi:large subunit ribosomal protein L18
MRLRQRIQGTAERPRMAIYVSNKHMYVQFIDDTAAQTLAAMSTLKAEGAEGCNLNAAKVVGEQAAKAAADKGIVRVVVDRGGFRYHGRVKQIVESAVAAGLRISDAAPAAEEAK